MTTSPRRTPSSQGQTPARPPTSAAAQRVGVWVLEDQLHPAQAALASYPDSPVLVAESADFLLARPSHGQKVVMTLAAMRHFADELRASGRMVDHHPIHQTAAAGGLARCVADFARRHRLDALAVVRPTGHDIREHIDRAILPQMPCPVRWLDDKLFFVSIEQFRAWASAQRGKRLVMENWYRHVRKEHNILLDADGQPTGGQWNFDKLNRKVPRDPQFPPPTLFAATPHVLSAQADVGRLRDGGAALFGEPSAPFHWPVTRPQAREALDQFLQQRLELFGPYEDAMHTGSWQMWHSALSPAMDLGLITAREVVERTLDFVGNHPGLPLQSLEGFVRQIIGWREYVRGIYALEMPAYRSLNALDAHAPLPAFYWDAQTDMACLRTCVQSVRERGYAHHIQRLMVLSNFAMLAGIEPQQVAEWFIYAFVDGHEWVVLPNTIGMSLYADGGLMATKPYAASANYIGQMSNYCSGCRYNPRERSGPDACPFNSLYWTFLDLHRERFGKNQRMSMMMRSLEKMAPEHLRALHRQREAVLASLPVYQPGEPPISAMRIGEVDVR